MYNKHFKTVIGTLAEMNCTKGGAVDMFLVSVLANDLNFRLSFLCLLCGCVLRILKP